LQQNPNFDESLPFVVKRKYLPVTDEKEVLYFRVKLQKQSFVRTGRFASYCPQYVSKVITKDIPRYTRAFALSQ